MRGVLRASLASASVGAQRFHARGHWLRLGLRLRVRSELAGHTLAAIWLRGLALRVDWRRGLAFASLGDASLSNLRRSDV
jgi:hypothetical protein